MAITTSTALVTAAEYAQITGDQDVSNRLREDSLTFAQIALQATKELYYAFRSEGMSTTDLGNIQSEPFQPWVAYRIAAKIYIAEQMTDEGAIGKGARYQELWQDQEDRRSKLVLIDTDADGEVDKKRRGAPFVMNPEGQYHQICPPQNTGMSNWNEIVRKRSG